MPQIHRISPTCIIAASMLSAAILTAANADQTARKHPFIAANAPEIARIRAAFASKSPEKALVDSYITQTDAFIDRPISFPPRGGQHNQWYQCQTCELALKIIDETHHKCSKCGKTYTGHPYDDVIFSKIHSRNLNHALTAAWAYAISENPKYARYAAKTLLGYADRYSKYPYHSASLETKSTWGARAGGHLYEQTLTEASALATQIAPAYDLIAETLTPAQQDHIQKGLLLPMLTSIDRNKAGKSNWQSWHNAAIIAAGALVNDPQWTEKALNDPKNGFHQQMKISVSEEGMWYENSWGYHFYTLKALLLTAEYARRLDIDIWSDPTLKKMFTLPVNYTMADGSLPRFGDDVRSRASGAAPYVEFAYAATKDPIAKQRATAAFEALRFLSQVTQGGSNPAPKGFPGLDFSDHLNYWEKGFRAVMITDTAFMRNARYHRQSDTADTLDYDRMAKVVLGVYEAVVQLARDEE